MDWRSGHILGGTPEPPVEEIPDEEWRPPRPARFPNRGDGGLLEGERLAPCTGVLAKMVSPATRTDRQLPDGRTAFRQERLDDCLRPCIATVLQVHLSDVPDPQIDACRDAGMSPEEINRMAMSEMQSYLAGFGLRAVFHSRAPVERDSWIGVSPGSGRFQSHTVVMERENIVHDPAEGFPVPPGCKVAPVTEISGGITLDPLEDSP